MKGRLVATACLVAIAWGMCYVLLTASLPMRAPLVLAGLRGVIGGGLLGAFVLTRTRRSRSSQAMLRRHVLLARPGCLPPLPLLFVLALANGTLALGSMYLAAGQAEATVASIVTGMQPLVLVVAGWTLFGDRVTKRVSLGMLVALGGVALVATASSGATSPEGLLLSLVGMAAPAGGTIVMRRLGSQIDVAATTSVQFLLGGAMLLAAGILLEPVAGLTWTPAALLSLLILGALGTGLAYVAWFWLLTRLSFVELGAAMFLVPLVGVAGAVAMGDRPTSPEWAGFGLVLAGIAIASLGGRITRDVGHAAVPGFRRLAVILSRP